MASGGGIPRTGSDQFDWHMAAPGSEAETVADWRPHRGGRLTGVAQYEGFRVRVTLDHVPGEAGLVPVGLCIEAEGEPKRLTTKVQRIPLSHAVKDARLVFLGLLRGDGPLWAGPMHEPGTVRRAMFPLSPERDSETRAVIRGALGKRKRPAPLAARRRWRRALVADETAGIPGVVAAEGWEDNETNRRAARQLKLRAVRAREEGRL